MAQAQSAMQANDFSKAEELMQQALKLREDMPEYWVAIGMARRRQENKDGARDAYQKALTLLENRNKNEKDIGQKAWVMALLGKTDEAVQFLNKSLKDHPDSTYLQKMADPRGLPRTFQSEDFKSLMAF